MAIQCSPILPAFIIVLLPYLDIIVQKSIILANAYVWYSLILIMKLKKKKTINK